MTTNQSAARPLWPLTLLAGLMLTMMVSTTLLGALLLYRPQREIHILADGLATTLQTRVGTVAAALAEAGVILRTGDSIEPPFSTQLTQGMEIRIDRARLVNLIVDGQLQPIITRINSPLSLLASAEIEYGLQDQVFLDDVLIDENALPNWEAPFSSLEMRRALNIIIIDHDRARTLMSTAATVGEALAENDITIYASDRVNPAPITPLRPDLQIQITRAKAIEVTADGIRQPAFVINDRVDAALAEAGWALGPLDYTRPERNTPITEGMNIQIVRVREEISEKREVIPYDSLWLANSELELDQRRYVGGQNGERLFRYRIRYENNAETQREQLSVETIREPQDEINYYGARIVLRTLDTELGPLEYWRVIRMEITSYHPYANVPNSDLTATGQLVTKGIVATHPDVIPYHTRVYVPGYGLGQVEDTGLGLGTTRRWLDLGYEEHNYIPWRKQENVYLLTPVPAEFPLILPP